MPRGREPEAVEADADETVEATEATKAADVKKSKCPRCGAVAESEHNYCHKCGDDLGRRTPQQMLGIELVPEDLDEYIFKGSLTKAMTCVGKNLTLRSSRAGDHKRINDFLMKDWGDKNVTQDFWDNLKVTAAISLAIVSFDEKAIGTNVQERVDWFLKCGSALTDILTNKVVTYNRAITDWLQDKDLFLGS